MKISSNLHLRAFGLLVAAFSAAAGFADVKISSQVHSIVMGRARPDLNVTTYYKGDLMRTDINGLSTIFDAKSGKVFVMNADKKIFADLADDPAMKNMKVEATAKVTPSDEHKTIAGYNATKYVANIHMTMTMNGPRGANSQDMDMEMDVWASPDLKSPFVPAHLMRSIGQLLRGMDVSGVKAFADEMGKIKGYPLEQDLIMDKIAGMPAGMGGSGPAVKYESVAQSVDENALSGDLFVVPADFKKVKPSELRGGAGGG